MQPMHNALVSDKQVAETRTRLRWWRVVLPLALLVVFGSWAVTSPVGSSPDDDYHLSSIWCAGGERSGVCEVVEGEPEALDLGILRLDQAIHQADFELARARAEAEANQ